MTIVAIVENDVVYFAGDSLAVNVSGNFYTKVSQTVQRESKVWVKDSMVFGGTGDERMLNLLRYEHEIPPYPAGQSKVKYLVSTFIPSLQQCFSKHEYRGDALDGEILLAIEKELFLIGSACHVCSTSWEFYSVGQAAPIVEGSLYTTGQLQLPPLQRLYLALLAAERHTDVVGKPFMYITSEMEEAAILDESVVKEAEIPAW